MGILNTILGGAIATAQQAGQNAFNADQAAINRDFQREMSNTAFQRQVHDMQLAGLNPALLYGSGAGSGASTPAGSAATAAGGPDIATSLLVGKQMKLLDAQTEKTLNEAGLVSRETAWKDKLSDAQLREIESRIGVNSAQVNSMEYDNAVKKSQELLNKENLRWIGRLNEAQIKNMNASSGKALAETAILELEKSLGHRLSSSELLAVADTLAAILGVNPSANGGMLGAIRRRSARRAPTPEESAGLGGRTGYTPPRKRYGTDVPGSRRTRYGSPSGGGR